MSHVEPIQLSCFILTLLTLNVSPAQGELGTWQNGKGVISLNSAEKIVG